MQNRVSITSPAAAVVSSINVQQGDLVHEGDVVAVVESMKVLTSVLAPVTGRIGQLSGGEGQSLQKGDLLMDIVIGTVAHTDAGPSVQVSGNGGSDRLLKDFVQRVEHTLDQGRLDDIAKRHEKGFRTARENLDDLVDPGSFVEYGQLAVAARSAATSKSPPSDRHVRRPAAAASMCCFHASATAV